MAIHNQAVIDDRAIVGKRAVIGDRAVIDDRAIVGKRAVIGAGAVICRGAVIGERVVIGERAVIGQEAFIHDGAVIRDGAVIGDRAVISEGTVIDMIRGGLKFTINYSGTVNGKHIWRIGCMFKSYDDWMSSPLDHVAQDERDANMETIRFLAKRLGIDVATASFLETKAN